MESKIETAAAKVREAARENILADGQPGGVNRAAYLASEAGALSLIADGDDHTPARKTIADEAKMLAENIKDAVREAKNDSSGPSVDAAFSAARQTLAYGSYVPPVAEHPEITAYKQRHGIK